jgi:ribonuclease R
MAKKTKDPHHKREAQKYENPIPSREYILEQLGKAGKALSFNQIAKILGLTDFDGKDALDRRLHAMVRDGQIAKAGRNSFEIINDQDLIKGRVIGHKDGFGFVIPDDGSKDLYLSPREMRLVFHGDRVAVREITAFRRNRKEGQIVRVLARCTQQLVGRYFYEHKVGFVRPEHINIQQDILIDSSELQPNPGEMVVVEITEQPSMRRQAMGKVIEILGEHMAPGMEIDVAIRAHNLPHDFPESVKEEIKSWTETVPESAYADRKDIRDLPLVTIDGEDAKDFDDAVYASKTKKGYSLYVAIADVSYYVKPGTALDDEAQMRGNSVYFPERVIPMLPEILSNGLCSLKPNVDRLCMVCEMHISNAGVIKHFDIYPAVMHSKARLTYSRVAAMLAGETHDIPHEVVPHIETLYQLYGVLRSQREKRGAIDFETQETKILFDIDKKIKDIVPAERNEAHKLIEECMLSANETVALFLEENGVNTLYRVHDSPKVERLEELRLFLAPFGLQMPGGSEPEPKHFAKLLQQISGRDDHHLLQVVLLRSMNQAIYTPENIGHFGLAYGVYTHFTSPIRRYPDLIVHRCLKAIINDKTELYTKEQMLSAGDHCSMTERRADDATRDVIQWLKCEYMQDHVGDKFVGVISGVTHFGIFVELQDIYVEGLVHVNSMRDDHYKHDATHYTLTGERTGQILRLGDKVEVSVQAVNLDDRKIDFALEQQLTAQQRTLKAKGKQKDKK